MAGHDRRAASRAAPGRLRVRAQGQAHGPQRLPYLSLELRDRSGTIPARAFREVDRLAARFERGDAIRVAGKVERFRGELVAEIDDVRRLEEGRDPADFLPKAYRDSNELAGFLEHLIEVHDPGLRAVVEAVLLSDQVAVEFRRAPTPAQAATPISAA